MADWLEVPYRQYGRAMDGADCWGLVRMVRRELRGDDLPTFLVNPMDKRGLTRSAHEFFSGGFEETDQPGPGAIVTVWRGVLCLHVAIVVDVGGRLAVLETNEGCGTRWMYRKDFERKYMTVKYHDDHH